MTTSLTPGRTAGAPAPAVRVRPTGRPGRAALLLGPGIATGLGGLAQFGVQDPLTDSLTALATAGAVWITAVVRRRLAAVLRDRALAPVLQDLVHLTAPLAAFEAAKGAPAGPVADTATGPAAHPAEERRTGALGVSGNDDKETVMTSATDTTPAHQDAAAPGTATGKDYVAQPGTGFLYVMSNQESGNSVRVFHRAADGGLTLAGTYPTGGLGGGTATDLNLALDPLVSQGALTISDDRRFLFAVDAGSDEVSVLKIVGDGLVVVDRVPSGGIRPMSITTHKNLVYVVNSTTGTVAGYTVANDGRLSAVDGSAHTLIGGANAGPSQIQFSPDGTKILVTERENTVIDVFHIDAYGRASAPVNNASHGIAPFGITFHSDDVVMITEVANSVSTYKVADDGTLTVITGSLPTTELAPCWSVQSITDPGIAYVANAQSGSISGIRFDENGAATLLTADGHLQVMRDQHAAQDIALSADGRFLYVLTDGYDEKLTDPRLPTFVDGAPYSGKMSISAFRVEARGGLTPIGGYGVDADRLDVNIRFGSITGYAPGLEAGHEGMVAT